MREFIERCSVGIVHFPNGFPWRSTIKLPAMKFRSSQCWIVGDDRLGFAEGWVDPDWGKRADAGGGIEKAKAREKHARDLNFDLG